MARRPGQNGCVVKKNGNWVGRFYTDVDDGNRVKKSIVLAPATSVTKPEARRKLREILEGMGINSMKYTIPTAPAITFGQACDRWEAEFLDGQKPATIKTMKSEVRKHLRPAFGGITLEKLTPSVVNQAIVEWRKQGLSPKSIKNLTITLALIRKHAGLERFAKGLLCLPKQTEAEVEPPYLSPSEMAAIIAEAKGKYRVVFATAAGTGMRVGELFGLRIADVDLTKGIIHVRRSVFEGAEQSPKTRNGVR